MKSEKITSLSGGHEGKQRRSYDDACGAAHALDLVGERWALLVMRELFWGPKRFSDIRAGLPGISANVLTQRLEGLEEAGIVTRRKLPPPASMQVYELTEWGRESEPIFQALGRWAVRSPKHDPSMPLSTSSFLLSLRTMIDAKRAKGLKARIGLCLAEETFMAVLEGGEITIKPGPLKKPDLTLTGEARMLAGAVYGGQLAALEAGGQISVEGDKALAERFVTLFPLPAKAG